MIGLLIHLCPLALSLSPALFMRCSVQSATGLSRGFQTAHKQYLVCGVSLAHIYTPYTPTAGQRIRCSGLAEPQLFGVIGLLKQRMESCWQTHAECGASVFYVAAVQLEK